MNKTFQENYFYEVVVNTNLILLENKNLLPASAIAEQIEKVYVPITEEEKFNLSYENDSMPINVSSVDVIEAIKLYPQELKLYGDLIGLVQWEREFWFNTIIDFLEESGKPMFINDIIKRTQKSSVFKLKFSVDLSYKFAESEILHLLVTFPNIFYKIMDNDTLTGNMSFFSSFQIGLNEWRKPSVTLLNEIIDLLKEAKGKLNKNRLLYKINNRGIYYKSDFFPLTENELLKEIEQNTTKFIIKENLIELLNSEATEIN